jgi:anti-anti-sigma factor
MFEGDHTDGCAHVAVTPPSLASADGLGEPPKLDGRPRFHVQIIERTAVIRFENAEFLFDEELVRALGTQLNHLVRDERHPRLLVNLGGVLHLSSAVLGKLAWLEKQVKPMRGQIQLCGLDPLLRDMLRITHLDTVFDVCDDEAAALGLLIH